MFGDDSKLATELIDVIIGIVSENNKNEALKILNNLKILSSCGSDVTAYSLGKIAKYFKGEVSPIVPEYDNNVKRELLSLYATAAEGGVYKMKLLEAGLNAHRSYDILKSITGRLYCDQSTFDMVPYVSDSKWSDKWIDELRTCAEYIGKHRLFGYDLMSIFTPEHNPHALYEVCYHLKDEDRYRISLEWLRDSHWTGSAARRLVYLYMYKPGYDWSKFIRPWLCSWAGSEIDELGSKDDAKNLAVLNKWIHVSPLLEHCLDNYIPDCGAKGWDYVYKTYGMFRNRFGCDGDDLAQQLQHIGNVPTEVLQRNTYYNESVKEWIKSFQESSGDPKSGNNPFNAASLMSGD